MRLSRLPAAVGLCQSDILRIARYCNSAEQRLLYCKEAGDEGWWGTFAEIAFNVSRDLPYITLPREVARLQFVNACNEPIAINNQFYEYLQFGNGRLPKTCNNCDSIGITESVTRNNVPTFVDLTNGPQIVRLYCTDAADVGKRVLLQGLDNNSNTVYSQDVMNRVTGIFTVLNQPFVDAAVQFNKITGIQKDITAGPVQVMQVDPTSGDEVLLSTMEAGEETTWYRRYYFDNLPCGCCPSPSQTQTCPTVQVTAIAKLEPLRARVDTDYFLIQNQEALIEEAQSIRYSEMDTSEAKQMSAERHAQAVRFLNGELTHYLGKDTAAVSFAPFGTARLERKQIGILI
jgi:hypothetical protein